MIWNPLHILRGAFAVQRPSDLKPIAHRWAAAAMADDRLCDDLIVLGEIMVAQPARLENGYPTPQLPDPVHLAYLAGKRDLALQLLALTGYKPRNLRNRAMETADYELED